jgi:Spy/CpxP family protein refolding chaperone
MSGGNSVVFRNIAAVLFIVCLSVPAFPQQQSYASAPMPHHQFGMMGRMPSDERIDRSLDTLQRTLNLNSSQVARIRELARSRRESISTIRDQAKPKFEQLMSLLKQENPDPSAVGRIVIELKGIHQQVQTKQADYEKQLSSILTPTQQQTVNSLRSQAQTFAALRGIGLLGAPGFPHGMMGSLSRSEMRGPDDE